MVGRSTHRSVLVPVVLAIVPAAIAAEESSAGGPPLPAAFSARGPERDEPHPSSGAALRERIDVELVLVPVSVRGPDGLPVFSLSLDDFTLYDGGAPQRIATFDPIGAPVSLVFALDTSPSMETLLPFAKAAANRFVRDLPRVFQVALLAFGAEVDRACDFTPYRDHFFYEVNRQRAERSGTAIFRVTREAVGLLAPQPGRRVAVVLTDGQENEVAPADEPGVLRKVLTEAREADVTLYFVTYGRSGRTAALDALASGTGGERLPASSAGRLVSAFERIASGLDAHYTLGFYPSSRPGPGEWRRLRVEVRSEGAVVASRPGYSLPPREPPLAASPGPPRR